MMQSRGHSSSVQGTVIVHTICLGRLAPAVCGKNRGGTVTDFAIKSVMKKSQTFARTGIKGGWLTLSEEIVHRWLYLSWCLVVCTMQTHCLLKPGIVITYVRLVRCAGSVTSYLPFQRNLQNCIYFGWYIRWFFC